MLYFLDLIGTFAFAVYGAHLAQRKGFDVFGIATSAAISAFGGGTICAILLNRLPAFFLDYGYAAAVAVGVLFAIVTFRYFERMHPWILLLDAVGLVTFAFLGAQRAAEAGLGGLGIVLFAVITAVGGGIMRDVAMKEIPLVFYRDLYATPALVLGVLYALLEKNAGQPWFAPLLLCVAFALRWIAIRFHLHLWRPSGKDSSKDSSIS